ncbi:hypothetical protein GCM10009749_11940 [Agromyces neolithicus]|uniref:Uncharacterized protein n=1 Tax=Agromyces neolithicus TaxID=269420 RepID=A0ABN2M0U5_9MICO
MAGLLVTGGTCVTSWLAGFSHGMSIADAFMTSGGDAAGSGAALIAIGVLSTLAAIFVALPPARLTTASASA